MTKYTNFLKIAFLLWVSQLILKLKIFIPKKGSNVTVSPSPGITTEDIYDYIKPL